MLSQKILAFWRREAIAKNGDKTSQSEAARWTTVGEKDNGKPKRRLRANNGRSLILSAKHSTLILAYIARARF